MRKGRDGEKKKRNGGEKNGGKKKRRMKIVATTSLPALDRLNVDRWNAARSRQKVFDPKRFQSEITHIFKHFGASVRRSSGRRSGGRLLAMT